MWCRCVVPQRCADRFVSFVACNETKTPDFATTPVEPPSNHASASGQVRAHRAGAADARLWIASARPVDQHVCGFGVCVRDYRWSARCRLRAHCAWSDQVHRRWRTRAGHCRTRAGIHLRRVLVSTDCGLQHLTPVRIGPMTCLNIVDPSSMTVVRAAATMPRDTASASAPRATDSSDPGHGDSTQ